MEAHGHHHSLQTVLVSDEAGDSPKVFKGQLLEDTEPAPGEFGQVAVYVTDGDNGFGWGVGCTVAPLKHLGDGKYGS